MTFSKILSKISGVLLGLPGVALAAGNTIAAPGVGGGNTAWTIYAFGNAQAVSDALRAVGNFTASSTFQSIVGMIAVLGVLGVGLSSGFTSAVGKKFISYIVAVFLTCYVLFGVKNDGPLVVNVEVMDVVDGTWKAPITIPAVVGIPASMISNAGQEITRQIEASFPIPEGMKMSSGAPFNLAAAMLNDASNAKINDSNLSASMAYYVQDCFMPAVALGAKNINTLLTSTNFLNDLVYPHKGIMVSTMVEPGYEGVNRVSTCAKAGEDLITYLNNVAGADASGYLTNATAWQGTPALNVVNSAADVVAQWSSNNGITDGGALVKQAAVLSAFKQANGQAQLTTGNSDFLTGLALEQAEQAQKTSWLVSAQVFNRTMGYIFAVLQVFVYAITPLMLAVSLIPGLGMALLKNFLQILLWLAIWQPMLAIVNFIILSMQRADLGGALNTGAGGVGLAISNLAVVSEKSANLQAAATFIGASVPALAWALVKGSVDFSRIIGSATGEAFSQNAANTMTTGNYSLNAASMDTFSANKHSVASSSAFGNSTVGPGGIEVKKMEQGGEQAPSIGGQAMQATGTSQGSIGDKAGASLGTANNQAAAHMQAGGNSAAAGLAGAHGQILNENRAASVNAGLGGNVGMQFGRPVFSADPKPGAPKGGPVTANGAPDALGQFSNLTTDNNGSVATPRKSSLDAKAGVNLEGRGNNTWGTGETKTLGLTENAQRGVQGSDMYQASDANQRTEGYNTGRDGSLANSRSVSAPLTLKDRYDLERASYSNSNWGHSSTGGDQRGWRDAQPTEMDQSLREAQTGFTRSEFQTFKAEVDAKQGEQEAARLADEQKALEAKRRAEAEAQAGIAGATPGSYQLGVVPGKAAFDDVVPNVDTNRHMPSRSN